MTMTIDEMWVICELMREKGKGHWPVSVAFEWKGDTVLSDIVSVDENGMSLQLNEETFMTKVDNSFS